MKRLTVLLLVFLIVCLGDWMVVRADFYCDVQLCYDRCSEACADDGGLPCAGAACCDMGPPHGLSCVVCCGYDCPPGGCPDVDE